MIGYRSTNPFILVDFRNDKVLDEFAVLGILYDTVRHSNGKEYGILIKHGKYDYVEEYYIHLKENFYKIGVDISGIVLLKVDMCAIEDINFVITHSALPIEYYEKIFKLIQ